MSKHFREGFQKATCQCLKSGEMTGLPSMVVEESLAGGGGRQLQVSPSKFCCKHQEQRGVVTNHHGLRMNKSRATTSNGGQSSSTYPKYVFFIKK